MAARMASGWMRRPSAPASSASVPGRASVRSAAEAMAGPGPPAARSTSSMVTAPPGPEPSTAARSTPSSAALRRARGDAGRCSAGDPGRGGAGALALRGRDVHGRRRRLVRPVGPRGTVVAPMRGQRGAIGVPTRTVVPGSTRSSLDRPRPRTPRCRWRTWTCRRRRRCRRGARRRLAAPATRAGCPRPCRRPATASGTQPWPPTTSRAAATMRSTLGSAACSRCRAYGIGTSTAATRGHRGVEVVERALGDPRGDLCGHADAAPPFVDDDGPVGARDRGEHRRIVERAKRAQIDDLGLDSVRREQVGRLEARGEAAAVGDDREVGARATDGGAVEVDRARRRRHVAGLVVQRAVLEDRPPDPGPRARSTACRGHRPRWPGRRPAARGCGRSSPPGSASAARPAGGRRRSSCG